MMREPKPVRAGTVTVGPPRSLHRSWNLSLEGFSLTDQSKITFPRSLDNAPYLMALVHNSWRAIVSASAVWVRRLSSGRYDIVRVKVHVVDNNWYVQGRT